MERIQGDGKIAYKMVGGSCMRWSGKLIKPGEVVRLNPDEIPENFKDLLIPMERVREKTEPPIEVTKTEYSLQPRGKSKSLFDVVTKVGVDEDGKDIFKAINEKALGKEQAENLLSDLLK
jgi:hypothetical protein